ncbi:MAG: STAS domain-containing protein [Planctomycetes bacterium]|nr:STAS domain-containing protein [Planctomycetota bacterium]
MKGKLNVRVATRAENSAHVVVEGSLDAFTFDEFRKAVAELTEAGNLWMVLDLRSMTYIASVAINFLINLRVQRRKSGGEVIMVQPQPAVMNILKMLGLTEVLVISPTVEEAWTEIRARISSPGKAGGPPIE